MSLARPLLNTWLRFTEKPQLRRASDPDALRRSFETKAKLFFHAPAGTDRRVARVGSIDGLEIRRDQHTDQALVLYFHGGGYIFGSPATHAAMLARFCKEARVRAFLPDYRKAPEHPFPAALDDALEVYDELLAQGEERIILGGDSAGGGLALALLGQLIATKRALPSGLFAFSPLTDLSFSSASLRENAQSEVVLPADRIAEITDLFLDGHTPTDPRASPVNAEFTGAPPVWLTYSDSEILADDSTQMAARLRSQGVQVTCAEERDLPHVWPIFHNYLPEARTTLRALAGWIKTLGTNVPN